MAEGMKIHVCVVDGLYSDLAKTGVPLSIVATVRTFDGQRSMVSQADIYMIFCVLLLVHVQLLSINKKMFMV